ncbi:MAG: hypothetical protein RIF32_10125 [Leptospirales bacterium]|jgi:hypothetical protein
MPEDTTPRNESGTRPATRPPVSESLAAILERERDRLNERFAVARHMHPRLDEASFVANFLDLSEALVASIAGRGAGPAHDEPAPKATAAELDDLVRALFDQTAWLCGKGFLTGAGGAAAGPRVPGFPDPWRKLVLATPALGLRNPRRHLAATGNALLQLLRTPGANLDLMLNEWPAFAHHHAERPPARAGIPACVAAASNTDATPLTPGDLFELAGRVIAWRAGMAGLRSNALKSARRLASHTEAAACAALGVIGPATEVPAGLAGRVNALIDCLAANPWRTPADALAILGGAQAGPGTPPPITPVLRRLGAFAGFDGLFVRPPEVLWSAHGPIFDDREGLYILDADVFGHAFRRVRLDDFEAEDLERGAGDAAVEFLNPSSAARGPGDEKTARRLSLADGVVVLESGTEQPERYEAPQLKNAAHWTSVGGHSLYATIPTSHLVYVIGFPH